jgi:hypothetical protein
MKLSEKLNIYNENYTDQQIKIMYNKACMTVVDPATSNSGFEMEEIEFQECIARMSE